MKNLTLQLRGMDDVSYELVKEFLHSYIVCLNPSIYSFAHLIDDFDDDGSASVCVLIGTSDFESFGGFDCD